MLKLGRFRGTVLAFAVVTSFFTSVGTMFAAVEFNCGGSLNIDFDVQIKGCTAAIQSGRWQGSDLAWAFVNRGYAYDQKRNFDRAITDYNEAIRLDPDHVSAYQNRAASYRDKKQYGLALDDLNRAIKLAPDRALLFMCRAVINFKLGSFARSIADYDASLRMQPKFAGSLYGRGVAKIKLGDVSGGNKDISEARAIQADIAADFAKYQDVAL